MTDNPTLTIDRLDCRVALAGAVNPGVVRDAVERVARDDLIAVLSDLELPEEGDAVYRLRDLRLELWLGGPDEPREALAARWGRALGTALQRALRADDPARVMRFESPRAYRLHFLRDLIDGRAWSLWYYDEFAALRLLPDARAALEMLVQRPEWLIDLLRDLQRSGHLERLLARWSAAALARLWAALGLRPEPAGAQGVAAVAPLWTDGRVPLSRGADERSRAFDAFRLWLSAPAHDAATLAAARLLVDMAALLRLAPEARNLLLMETEFYPILVERLRARGALQWLGALPESAAGRAVLARAAEAVAGRAAAAGGEPDALSSAAGGVFLLLGALREGGYWPAWLAEFGEETARPCLFVVALKALGGRRAPLHREDRLLAAFAGLEEPPESAPLGDATTAAWTSAYRWLTPELDARLSAATDEALRRFAATLPGFAGSSAGYLADKFLAQPGLLLREPDEWLVHLDGGPLRMVLRMAPLPDRLNVPWLPLPVTCTVIAEGER